MRKMMILAGLSLASFTATSGLAEPEKPTPEKAQQAQAAPETAKPTANDSSIVSKKVAEDWDTYDVAKKGHLNREEFSRWMADLRKNAGQPAPEASWLDLAFAQTDVDADKKITKEELKRFLAPGT